MSRVVVYWQYSVAQLGHGVSAFPGVSYHHHEKTEVLIKNLKWKHSLGEVEGTQQLFSHSKLHRWVGVGRWKEVQKGRKGRAEDRGCLGDGKAGAENMGLELLIFSLEPGRRLGWQMRMCPLTFSRYVKLFPLWAMPLWGRARKECPISLSSLEAGLTHLPKLSHAWSSCNSLSVHYLPFLRS